MRKMAVTIESRRCVCAGLLWFRPPQPANKIYPAGFLLQTWLEGSRVVPVPAASLSSAAVSAPFSAAPIEGAASGITAAPVASSPQPSIAYSAGSTTPVGTGGATVFVSGPDPWRWFISVNFMDCEPSGILNPGGSMIGTRW